MLISFRTEMPLPPPGPGTARAAVSRLRDARVREMTREQTEPDPTAANRLTETGTINEESGDYGGMTMP
jgi:hypothetical protein